MTKEVVVTICGRQTEPGQETNIVETKARGEYYERNQHRFLLFEEEVEGFPMPIKNMLRFTEDFVEMTKKGPVTTKMTYKKGENHLCPYQTPYGEFLFGMNTKEIRFFESENQIRVIVDYAMEIEEKHFADCQIIIKILSA